MQTHKTVVLVIDGLFSNEGDESFIKNLPGFKQFAAVSPVHRLAVVPQLETSEALLLGMSPDKGQLRQGPLTVAALGADPPEKSTHFHLSLLSLVDDVPTPVEGRLSSADEDTIIKVLSQLNTKLLTLVRGEQYDHGLVWERLAEMRSCPVLQIDGRKYTRLLPEGDGENQILRFIDDSINILCALELNQRRTDNGLLPVSIAWPWGNGVRLPLPNLSLRYGEPIWVESSSMRLQGLSRLVGLRHGRRSDVGYGLQTRLEWISKVVDARGASVLYLTVPRDLRAGELWEELDWFLREVDSKLLDPLLEWARDGHHRLTLIGPNWEPGGHGLWGTFDLKAGDGHYPFDERTLDEPKAAVTDLWEVVRTSLSS